VFENEDELAMLHLICVRNCYISVESGNTVGDSYIVLTSVILTCSVNSLTVIFCSSLSVWLDVMVPMMDMRNYTTFVVNYLKDILTQTPQGRPVHCEQFFAVLDVIHSPSNNLPSNVRQELLSLSPTLRVCIF